MDSPEVRTWSGYAFEQVCLVHLPMIKKALGINGMHTQASAWYGSFNNDKAQIDLLIDRKDGVINICEIKFSNNEFLITKKYAQEIRKKIGVFVNNTNTTQFIINNFEIFILLMEINILISILKSIKRDTICWDIQDKLIFLKSLQFCSRKLQEKL